MKRAQPHRRTAAQILCLALLCVGAPMPLCAQQTSLTLYTDGRVVVRRGIPAAVQRGTATISADLGMRDVDPASITAVDEGVQVRGVRVLAAIGLDAALRRAIGTELFFREEGSTVRGTVLSVDPMAVRIGDMVMYGLPGTPLFPDSLVQLNPRYELTLESVRPMSALNLLYMSSGLAWSANYTVLLPRGGSGQAAVTGVAQIMNGAAATLTGAQVQLLAGDVRRAAMRRMMEDNTRQVMRLQAGAIQASETPSEEGVGGTHVYQLPGTYDFIPGETRTIALFPRGAAPVEPVLVLHGQWGFNMQWPEMQRDLHPEIGYRLSRPANTPFGQVPLPAGIMRLFEPDSAGRPQLIGEVPIPHTPAGRDVRVTTGTSFDVTAQRTQTAYEARGQREATSAYRVELQNAATRPARVLVTDMCPGRCEILSTTGGTAEQPATNMIGFRVEVPAGGSATLEYRVRARW